MSERDELDFRVMRALSGDPQVSQRQLAQSVGVSLGAVNYCLKALVAKGFVKVQNFSASENKMRYAYVLTPQGVMRRAALAIYFLRRKLVEYEQLRAEIEQVKRELGDDRG